MSNLKKNKTWAAIHAEFNVGGDQNRSLRQLKTQFDNMKRNARKVITPFLLYDKLNLHQIECSLLINFVF